MPAHPLHPSGLRGSLSLEGFLHGDQLPRLPALIRCSNPWLDKRAQSTLKNKKPSANPDGCEEEDGLERSCL